MHRTCCLFSVVTALTVALVLFSVPVYADEKSKCPEDAVCKKAAKTFVEKYVYVPKVKPAPTPATEARPAPGPASEKKEPAAAEALVVQEKAKPTAEPESKPAPAAATKPDAPKKPEKPTEPKGGDDDLVSVHPGDVTAGAEAAMNHGFQAGYTKGHADGMAAATTKKYRIMSREEVIKLSLDAAQKAIERRLGPSPEKKAP